MTITLDEVLVKCVQLECIEYPGLIRIPQPQLPVTQHVFGQCGPHLVEGLLDATPKYALERGGNDAIACFGKKIARRKGSCTQRRTRLFQPATEGESPWR